MSSPASIGQSFNELGHDLIDMATGRESALARAEFNDLATGYQLIGLIAMVASAIFMVSFLTTSLLITSLALAPLVAGYEIIIMGENAKELVNSSFIRGLSLFVDATIPEAEFSNKITEGTCLMSCLAQEATWITSPLYEGYLEARR